MTRLSFTTMGTPDLSGVEAIQAARRYGYQGVDLRVSDHKGELKVNSTPGEIAELRRAFDAEGIAPAGLLCYNETGSKDDLSWAKMEESLIRHLEIGAALGSPSIRMFGGRIDEYTSADEFIGRTADVLRSVFRKDRSDVQVLLQNHGGSCNFMQGVELMGRVGHERFGMVFSPDHCLMMGEDMNEVCVAARFASRQLYLADVVRATGPAAKRPFHGVLPGKGIVPLKRAYDAIGGSAFAGWISFKWEKIWQDDLEGPEVALPHFVEWFTFQGDRS
jgi:sugar phosphate isomerase/epimerase